MIIYFLSYCLRSLEVRSVKHIMQKISMDFLLLETLESLVSQENTESVLIDANANGHGYAPGDVNGASTIAYFNIIAQVPGKPPEGEPIFVINGGLSQAGVGKQWMVPENDINDFNFIFAKVNLYATLSFWPNDFEVTYVTHHHDVESNFPPDIITYDDLFNVGAQSDPH